MLHRFCTALVVLLALACVSPEAWAQRRPPDFRVNTYTANNQFRPSVARLSDGGFVVTWMSELQDVSSLYGVYGQRYSAAGVPVGGEFRVNTTTSSATHPSVAGLGRGGFVVTWATNVDNGSDEVYGRRYSAAGVPAGSEFRVNTHTANDQYDPSVAGLSNGGFVVTWTSDGHQDGSHGGVYGQRYSAAGAPALGEFRVNLFTLRHQSRSSVAGLSNGDFVVTWTSDDQEPGLGGTTNEGVYARRYSASGARIGGEFLVNTHTANIQRGSSVAGLGDGGFVVTWSSYDQDDPVTGNGQPRYYGVYGQHYSALGARFGGEFLVNTHTANHQEYPSVASLDDGGFVVTWQSKVQDGSEYGVYGQRYSAAGARAGGEFRVNTYTASLQKAPAVAGLSNGGFVVTWQSSGQDGSGGGVYGQRYGNFAPEITLDPVSQTVRSGQTVTFTANASGKPTPSVQWQLSTNGGGIFTNIASATAKTFTFSATSRSNGNQYRAVFSNSLGTATTKAATLTVGLF